jgi:hypothetical protein
MNFPNEIELACDDCNATLKISIASERDEESDETITRLFIEAQGDNVHNPGTVSIDGWAFIKSFENILPTLIKSIETEHTIYMMRSQFMPSEEGNELPPSPMPGQYL